jgi:hypothetical protein
MRDWIFKLLFPKQYKQINHISDLLHINFAPDFHLTAPKDVCFKDIYVYLVTDTQGNAINCEWSEVPYIARD